MRFFTSLALLTTGIGMLLLSGCYHNGRGIPYVALTCPEGTITTVSTNRQLYIKQRRNGFFFWNDGFRPAPDASVYLELAHKRTHAPILRNADMRLSAPFIILPLPFGPQFQPLDAPDLISANKR